MGNPKRCLDLVKDLHAAEAFAPTWKGRAAAEWQREQRELGESGDSGPRWDEEGFAPPTLRYQARQEGLTAYAGMPLFIGFTQQAGLGQLLRRELTFRKRESEYAPAQLAAACIDAIVCGIERIEHTNLLRQETALARARGLTQYPDHATFHRFISGFSSRQVRDLQRVHEGLLRSAMRPAGGKPRRVALDCDVHAVVVYGKQEEAAFGYPHSRDGHRQYNLRAAMVGNCGELVDSELLAGNVHSSTGASEFLERVLRALPEGLEVVLYRLDAGFFSLAMLEHLEGRRRRYLIGLPLFRSLRTRVAALPEAAWKRVTPGQEVAELRLPFGRRQQERRVIVARHLEPQQPAGEQAPLEGLEAGPRYHYFALVTNIDRHSPKKLWQSYGRRASIEALFKEAKLGFGLDRLPSAKHVANQAYIKLVFLAYNLVHWFRRHVLAGGWTKARIKTLREWLLRIPAKVMRTATGWVIDLPRGHPSLGALQQIQRALTSA